MRKRVLQLIGSFNQGGSERQAIALCRLLKADGTFEVYAATLNNEGILRRDIEALDLPHIPEFPLTSFFNVQFVKQAWSLARYIKENQIDIVHTHDFYTNIFGTTAASLAGVKVRIASKRETGGMRSANQDAVEKLAFKNSTAIIVNSRSVEEYLLERGISGNKLNVIYNGLDVAKFDLPDRSSKAILKKYSIPDHWNRMQLVTIVANLRHDVKNIPMLLHSAKAVLESDRYAHFVIAGEGALRDPLQKMSIELGVSENVHFIGRCTDVPELLACSDICVLTSVAEGFSNSILEYMASAKPVVATNVGGANEAVIHGETGYLVDSNDDRALASRILELLTDKEKASEFGKKGRRIALEKFSESAQLQRTLALYDRLLLK